MEPSSISMPYTNAAKGLLNAPGDNNCFLNSAVQVLWHLDAFRRSFRQISGHTCMGNGCIFCALKVIFVQFQYSDQPALPPDALRKALAKTFADQHRFQLGLMDDAAECFDHIISHTCWEVGIEEYFLSYYYNTVEMRKENILLRIHFHLANQESEDMCNAKHCIPHQKFAMTLVEQVTCVCGATSEPLTFTQMVHYVSASALVQLTAARGKKGHGFLSGLSRIFSGKDPVVQNVSQAKTTRGAPFEWNFAELLKAATNSGDVKTCPSKCGKEVQLTRTLMNTPDVVSIGLIWDSDRPTADHIKDVVRCIGTVIQPAHLFSCTMDDRWARTTELHLVGVVCYYGKHYSTFFFHTPLDRWYSFDDSNVRDMGSSWDIVVEKCCRGHYQPLLLLYANKQGQPVSVATAPDRTVIVEDFDPGGPGKGGGGGPRHTRQKSTESTASSTCGGQSSQFYNYETTLNDFVPGPVAWNPDQRSISPNMDGLSTLVRVHKKPGADIVHFRQSSYLSAMDTVVPNGHCNGYPTNPTREQLVNLENSEFLDFDYNRVESNGGHVGQYGRDVDGRSSQYAVSGQMDHRNVGQAGQLDHRNAGPAGQQDVRYTGQTGQLDHRTVGQYPCANNALDMWQGYATEQNGQTYPNNQQQEVAMSVRQPGYQQNGDCVDGRVTSSNALHTQPERYGYHQQQNQHGHYYHQQPYQNQPIHQNNHPSQPSCCDRLQNSDGGHTGGNNKGRSVEDGNPAADATPSPALKEWLNTHVQQLSSAGLTMKRTKSMEDTKHVGKPATGQVPVSRRRPQSARPFDYGNTRPVRTAHDGQWPVESRTASSHPQWNTTQNLANSQQKSRQDVELWNRQKDINEEDIYISSKTVQNILQRQRSQVGRATPDLGRKMTTPVLDNKLHDGKHQQNDRSEVTTTPCDLLDGPLDDALKVDIPADNTSLSSQRDSGYRSGESGGDRNSASSTSSTYAELGMMTSHDVRQPGYWPVSNRADCVSYSSSESLNWTDKSSCGSVKLDRVSEIPHTANDKDGECERLCLQAEGLMDLSRRKEHEGDLAVSLIHCTKGLGYLQEALSLEGCTQEMKVHSRTRHSACVLRSRSLHRKILSRQVSNPSTASSDVNSEDHSSLSSLSTEQDSLDSKPESFSGDKPRCHREATKHVTAQKSARRPEMQGRHTPVSEIWKTYTSSVSVPGRQSCTPTKQMLRTLSYSPVNDTRSSKNSTPTNDIVKKDTRGKDVIEQSEYNYNQHVEDRRIMNCGRLQSGKHTGEVPTGSHTRTNGYMNSSSPADPHNSSSSLDDEELSPARTVQIYGTLPRKSKKKATTVPSSESSVYQDYLVKQKNASQLMSGKVSRSQTDSQPPAPQVAQSATSKHTSQPKHYVVNPSTHAYNQVIYQQNSSNQASQQVRPPSREGLLDGELMQKTAPSQRQYRPPSREGLLMEDGTQKTPCQRQYRPPSREGLLSEETVQKSAPCQRPRPPSREGLLTEDGRQETAAYQKQFRPSSREGVLTEERLQQKPSSYQVTPGTAQPAQVTEFNSHHKQTSATKAPYDPMIHTQLKALTLNSTGVANRTTDSHHSAGVTNVTTDPHHQQFHFDHNGFPVGKVNDRRRRGSEGSCIADDVTQKPWQPLQLNRAGPYEMNDLHCVRQGVSGHANQYQTNSSKNDCQPHKSGAPSYGYCNGKNDSQDRATPVLFPKPSMIKKMEQQTRQQTVSTVSGHSKKPQPPRKPNCYQQDVKSSNMMHRTFHPATYTQPVTEHIQGQETPATAAVSEEGIHKMSADSVQSSQTVDGSQSDYVKVTHNKMKPKVKDCKKTLGSHGKSSKKDTTGGQYYFNCAESKLPKKAVDLDQCLTCKFSNTYCMCQIPVGNSYENNQQFSSFSALEDSTPTVSVISNEVNTANVHPDVTEQSCFTNPNSDVTNSGCHCTSGSVESATHPEQCVLPSYQKNVTDVNCNQSVPGMTSQLSVTSEPDKTVLHNQSVSHVTSLSRSASEPDRIVSALRSKTPDPKSALSKRKRRGGKRSKSVTFSDNIAYIGTLDEAAPTIDYIAYATEFLGRCQNRLSQQGSHDEDQGDTSSSESEEDSYVPPTPDNSTMDKVRCNLCRRKFISTTEVYCVDCGHYMSKFHVPSS